MAPHAADAFMATVVVTIAIMAIVPTHVMILVMITVVMVLHVVVLVMVVMIHVVVVVMAHVVMMVMLVLVVVLVTGGCIWRRRRAGRCGRGRGINCATTTTRWRR